MALSRVTTINTTSSANVATGGRDGFSYGNIGGDVIDAGLIAQAGVFTERLFDLFEGQQEANENEVMAAQEFARSLGQDFLGINLQSERTEAAQLASDRTALLRFAIPFLAIAVVGYAAFKR